MEKTNADWTDRVGYCEKHEMFDPCWGREGTERRVPSIEKPLYIRYNEEKRIVGIDCTRFPETFHLRGFPDKLFSISERSSFYSPHEGVQIVVLVKREDGTWIDFLRAGTWEVLGQMKEKALAPNLYFDKGLSARQLADVLLGLPDPDKPILIGVDGWYKYVKSAADPTESYGAEQWPVIQMGGEFDGRDF